jgi:hypothetical protein
MYEEIVDLTENAAKTDSSCSILPREADVTLQTWVDRINETFGKCSFYYTKTSAKHSDKVHEMKKVKEDTFLSLLSDSDSIATFGKWSVKKPSSRSVVFERGYLDVDGRNKVERLRVNIG